MRKWDKSLKIDNVLVKHKVEVKLGIFVCRSGNFCSFVCCRLQFLNFKILLHCVVCLKKWKIS